MRPAQSRRVPRPPGRALTCASAPCPRRGSGGPPRYAIATGPQAAPGQPHDHAALQVRKRARQLTSAARNSHGQGQHRRHLPVARPARVTANPGSALGRTPTAPQGHRPQVRRKQHSSWSDRPGPYRFCAWPAQASGVSPARKPDPNRSTIRLLLYFAAVLDLNPGLIFSNCTLELWRYGDSNSGPLACHTHSGRRPTWPGVALCRTHLRLPWLDVAWRRLVPAHLGSPLGSQNSLVPLIFEAPATRPRRDSHQR
jgi:hypothetical protein